LSERKESKLKFVNLHAHDVYSVGDGLGYPQEHFDAAWNAGLDAHSITNHGNMSSLPYMFLHQKEMKRQGKEFKVVYGVEAYFHPSIEEWEELYNEKKQKKEKASTIVLEDEERTVRRNPLNKRRHMVLLAQNQTGLNNLFRMVSQSYQSPNFYRFPRIDYKMLEQYNEGVVATSACLGGIYAGCYWENREEGDNAVLDSMRETSRRMLDIFGDRWYAEIQWNTIPEQHELNKYVIQIAEEFNIPLVSTVDCHYPVKEQWQNRELYKRLAWLGKKKIEDLDALPENIDETRCELFVKNGDEVFDHYKSCCEKLGVEYDDEMVSKSIERTFSIAHDLIEDYSPETTVRLPNFVVPDGETPEQALRSFCEEGLRRLNLHDNKEYVDRLNYELEIINGQGFAKYFLTMKAISDRAVSDRLIGAGRGSAAGALASYVLGITQVDPIRFGLLFERFMSANQAKLGMPDIDYDVERPQEFKEKLIEEWGADTVVPITNWNTLKLRSLIKDISKFYDIPYSEVNKVTGKMIREATPQAKKDHGITAGVYSPTFEELKKYSESLKIFLEKNPQISEHINVLHGQIRSASRHAGGVVIAENLNEHMPLIRTGGVTQTPWSEGQNVRHLEPMGFIKFDILGLTTLEMIERAISHVLRRHHDIENPTFEDIREYYDKNLHPDIINFDDQNVYENIFQKGKFAGVFQFSESGAQNFCKNALPTSLADLATITSIYRPGPLGAKVDRSYLEMKKNPEMVVYEHPIIEEVLGDNHGFIIFQEDLAQLAHRLGDNITLDEGNKLRKLLIKKGSESGPKKKERKSLYERFVKGCTDKGLTKDQASDFWEKMAYFSKYGFNKSHAISYTVISYQCAWLLNYYPAEWVASYLDFESEKKKEFALNTAKSFGFNIETLNINTSGVHWEISDDGKTLIQPLTAIKGMGDKAIEQIIDNRPFENVEELLFNDNIVYSKLNKKTLDVLVRSQAMNCLMDDRFNGMRHFWMAVATDRPKSKKALEANIETYAPEGDFLLQDKVEYLSDLTGMFPIELVLSDKSREKLEELYVPPISQYDPELQLCWFIPREVTKRIASNGREYFLVKAIDDTSATSTIWCWGITNKDRIELNRPYMAKLKYSQDWGFSSYSVRKNFKMLPN
jgi:DNA polymerase-3 subunit alpha